MKKIKYSYIYSFLIILLTLSCSKDIDNINSPKNELSQSEIRALILQNQTHNVSISEAKNNAISFLANLDNTKSNSRIISDIQVITDIHTTKTKGMGMSSIDTLMYAINFENNMGFVLISADKRTDEIIGFSTEGNINTSESNPNPGSKILLNNAKTLLAYQIKESNYLVDSLAEIANEKVMKSLKHNDIKTKGNSQGYWVKMGEWKIKNINAVTKTTWGQGKPYNLQCPMIDNQLPPAGCIATAVSQILAYHKKFPVGYNWDLLTSSPEPKPNDTNAENEVARLMREIGVGVNMQYALSGSGSNITEAEKYLKQWFNLVRVDKYSETDITNSILRKSPVYVQALNANNEGHAWILDGTAVNTRTQTLYYGNIPISSSDEIQNYLRSNFGWPEVQDNISYFVNGVFFHNNDIYNKKIQFIHSIIVKQ